MEQGPLQDQTTGNIEGLIRRHLTDVLAFPEEAQDKVIQLARRNFKDGLEQLESAAEGRDCQNVSRLAHRLKGNLINAGLAWLAEAAGNAEEAGRHGNLEAVVGQVRAMKKALGGFVIP
jgi:hypothetical protein